MDLLLHEVTVRILLHEAKHDSMTKDELEELCKQLERVRTSLADTIRQKFQSFEGITIEIGDSQC